MGNIIEFQQKLTERQYGRYYCNEGSSVREIFTYDWKPQRDIRKEMIKGYMKLLSK